MKFKNYVFTLLFSFGLLLFGCVKNNPDPSWILVNKWTLQSNINQSGAEGELTQNFTNAWVYVNDECIGVFELPVKIPVLKSGAANIKIYPAVLVNGISDTKKIYPFCSVFSTNVTLVQNETLSVSPTTHYVDNAKFIIEDFEGANVKLQNDPNTSSANFFLDNIDLQSFNGNAYAHVVLNTTDSNWVGYTTFNSYLPKGKEVFLEIDYYNTNAVTTGLLAIAPSGLVRNVNIQLNKQDPSTVKWKKMYIDLRELIGASDINAYFDHSFEAWLTSGVSTTDIRIDNIKVVYFQ